MYKKRNNIIVSAIFLLLTLYSANVNAGTLENVKARGYLLCGVSSGVAGFSIPDQQSRWQGIDVDYCRAVASAIFNDPDKVRFVALTPKEKYPALSSKQIDMLARNSTWTFSRDVGMSFEFPAINYYDGQGFMVNVKKNPGVTKATDLDGATVCVQAGTTSELNLSDYFTANKISYEPLVFDKFSEINAAYDAGRCDVYTTDNSSLYGIRLQLSAPDDHKVLPDIISKEPLAVMVRDDDPKWTNIVKWVHNVIVNAEEFGITKDNVVEMKNSSNPSIRRFLGVEKSSDLGKDLNLSKDWIIYVISGVGNYGEIFERNLGKDSVLNVPRGLNELWTKGGLMYGIPVR
ncbi:amino acid ABC transporter substrate-binding protein [Bartonella sp. DGB1]|uniref:amino acid ABC transporter substrate-binding protein n=1 Tax=Bartonella sp. DGB1 TaxID=3239807 RepID=UPI0035264A1B